MYKRQLLNSARPVILLLVVITTFIADSSADIIQALGLDPKAGGFDFNLGFFIKSSCYQETGNAAD